MIKHATPSQSPQLVLRMVSQNFRHCMTHAKFYIDKEQVRLMRYAAETCFFSLLSSSLQYFEKQLKVLNGMKDASTEVVGVSQM